MRFAGVPAGARRKRSILPGAGPAPGEAAKDRRSRRASEPRLPAGALHALHVLGITRADRFATAARETLLAWDRQLHAGERTAELS